MKRFLPAVIIAILFHAALFALDPGLIMKRPGKMQKPAITVTMSYRKKPAPPPTVKKPPEIKNKKVLEKKPAAVKKIKSVPEPELIKKEEVIEDKIENEEESVDQEPVEIEDAEGHEGEVGGSILIVTKEAVPLYRVNPAPKYPKMARKRGYQGTVLLSVHVNKEGKVDDLWLFESSGYKILDNEAINSVKDWIFEPGRKGDVAVDMWVEVPVVFELK